MAGEVLQVDDVGTAFAGGRQCCDAERVDGDCRIKMQVVGVLLHECLDRSAREGTGAETVSPLAASGCCTTEERTGWIISEAGNFKPAVESLERFRVKGNPPLFSTLAEDLDDFVPATVAVITNAESREFSNSARGVGEDAENRTIADAGRRHRIGSIKQSSAIRRRESNSLAVSWNGRSLDEIAVGRVRTRVAVGLQVREE